MIFCFEMFANCFHESAFGFPKISRPQALFVFQKKDYVLGKLVEVVFVRHMESLSSAWI